jgi:hypothetical protein
MSHSFSSCRGRTAYFLQIQLDKLYVQRLAVDNAIRALQGLRNLPLFEARDEDPRLEFRNKPSNLTSCRSA